MTSSLPKSVSTAYPLLASATFIRRFAAPVPLVPDTTFDIFFGTNDEAYVLVTTDYVDFLKQQEELEEISGHNRFTFTQLLKPYDNATTHAVADEMDEAYFVRDGQTYYYAARLVEK